MKKDVWLKLAIAFTVLGVIAGVVSVVPLPFSLLVVIFAALVGLLALVWGLLCCFIWLFSGGKANLFYISGLMFEFAGKAFSIVPPMAYYSIYYICPIAAGVSMFFCILGIAFSAVCGKRQKTLAAEEEKAEEKIEAEVVAEEVKEDTAVPAQPEKVENASAPSEVSAAEPAKNKQSKKAAKKKRAKRPGCKITLALSIAFLIISAIGLAFCLIVMLQGGFNM